MKILTRLNHLKPQTKDLLDKGDRINGIFKRLP